MRKIIIAVLLLPAFSFAKTTVHQNKFSLNDVERGGHFWARFYEWKAWAKTEDQSKLGLTTNFVKKAYDESHARFNSVEISEKEFVGSFGPVEGNALYSFYDNREEVDAEEIGGASGLVTSLKVAVDLPDNFDVEGITLDQMYEMISVADSPHLHKAVSAGFAHNFLDPLHSGHKDLDNLGSGKVFMSIVNTANKYYNCKSLNTLLNWKAEAEGISSTDGNFRVHILNTVKEIPVDASLAKTTTVEGSPIRVFEQKIVYSSSLIKSGVNHLSFYRLPNGKKKMILSAVMVSTSKVKEVPGNYLNGIAITNEIFTGIKFRKGVAVLNSKNVDLAPISGACSVGLGQGIAKYVNGLANRIAK